RRPRRLQRRQPGRHRVRQRRERGRARVGRRRATRSEGAQTRDRRGHPGRGRRAPRRRVARVYALVMAAGEGRRLRPVTERWPKPVLPIDGRPVIVTLLHELRAAGFERVTVVTRYLAEQVEALLDGFPLELRFVRQPEADGSAGAVRAGLEGLPC